jgi:hypothetical protein
MVEDVDQTRREHLAELQALSHMGLPCEKGAREQPQWR